MTDQETQAGTGADTGADGRADAAREGETFVVDLAAQEGGTEPFWMELTPNLKLLCRPDEAWLWATAQTVASKRARALAQAIDDVKSADSKALLSVPFDRPDVVDGHGQMYFAEAVAELAVLDWEGVGMDGKKAEVTPENVRALFKMMGLHVLFLGRYGAHADRVRAEGNGSAAAPAGTGAAAATTAPSAEPTSDPAPADGADAPASSAPTSSTPRKASKGSKPGSS